MMGVRVGLKQIVQIACGSVGVVQIQLDECVARIFRDVFPDVQDVAAPPFRLLKAGESVVVFGFGFFVVSCSALFRRPAEDGIVGHQLRPLGALLRRQDEAGHFEQTEPLEHIVPLAGGTDPVGDGPELEDKRRIRCHFVELVEQGNLRIVPDPMAVIGLRIDLRSGFVQDIRAVGKALEHVFPLLLVICAFQSDARKVIAHGRGPDLGKSDWWSGE